MSNNYFKVGNVGVLYTKGLGMRKVDLTPPSSPPSLSPVALDAKLVVTGHSIPDAIFKWPWSGAIQNAGLTPNIVSSTGPYATASIRWNSRPVSPDEVRGILETGAARDLFLGGEAHGPLDGKYTVNAHITYSDAFLYALNWHNLACTTGAKPFYFNFWRVDETSPSFGSVWRADQIPEIPLWDSIIDSVNANRNPGTPAMRLVPWLQVFVAVYDAIQAGTVTGVTMGDFFQDEVHPSSLGAWVQMATVMAVMYQRHPDELSNVIPLQYTGNITISSGLAAQLRPVIWNACVACERAGLSTFDSQALMFGSYPLNFGSYPLRFGT